MADPSSPGEATEARPREERQAFLLRFSDVLRAEIDANAVAARAVRMVADELGLDLCYAASFHVAEDRADVTHQAVRDGGSPAPASYRLSDFPDVVRRTLDRTLVFDDLARASALSEVDRRNITALGFGAMVAVPLRRGPMNLVWSLTAVSREPRRWTAGEVDLLEDVAERTWIAIERARAEAAMRESEERQALAVEVGQFATWDWDLRTGRVTWNDRHFLLQGYRVGEVTASYDAWIARVHPDDRARTMALIDAARRSRTTYVHEFRTVHGDGSVHWCAARGRFFYDGAEPCRMLGVMQDVTDRRLAEEALREREERQVFLLRLADRIRLLMEPIAVMAAVSEEVGQHMHVGRCGYAEVPPPYDHLVVARDWTNGVMDSLQGSWPLSSFGDTVVAEYRAGRTVVYEDVLTDERVRGHEAAPLAAGRVRSSISVQLMKGHRWVASFYVQDVSPRAWTRSEITLMEEVAERTWAALERARAEHALQQAHHSLESRVRARTAEVHSLFSRLVSAQEEERRRITRDIHDQVGQPMTALRMNLEVLAAQVAHDPQLAAQAARTLQRAEELDRSIDYLTWALRPAALDHLGLAGALDQLVSGWSERFGIAAALDLGDTRALRLSLEKESNLYRLAQEALHNVFKHAQATHVSASLDRQGDDLLFVLEDDGRGFAVDDVRPHSGSGGIGLVSMRERAAIIGGRLTIRSEPGRGTRIEVRVPITTGDERDA
jgi:PAS domain S-box-containing protein